MKVKEVAKAIPCSEGVIRGALNHWEVGQTVTGLNIEGLKKYLITKCGNRETVESKLGINLDELTIEMGQRNEAQSSFKIEELEENNNYILRNYHFETFATYVGKTKVGGIELWVFRTDKGYKAYEQSDLNNGHFKILAAE